MKVYISGKITGRDIEEAKAHFERAEKYLLGITELTYEPVNPFKISPYHPDKTWEDYMIDDIRELLDCTAIYMLQGWGDSQGARIEYAIARELNLLTLFEDPKANCPYCGDKMHSFQQTHYHCNECHENFTD